MFYELEQLRAISIGAQVPYGQEFRVIMEKAYLNEMHWLMNMTFDDNPFGGTVFEGGPKTRYDWIMALNHE